MADDIYHHHAVALDGMHVSLADYRGKVLLIVNVASKCGFTPQYTGLEELYQRFRDKGFAVLGFPCNQFGKQEPGSSAEIATFCSTTYPVTFPMFGKVEVNGDGAHPLYKQLKAQAPGLLGSSGIKWNFTKFLVNREGEAVERFAPTVKPEDIAPRIARLLV
jgi:glutathione peroxidase